MKNSPANQCKYITFTLKEKIIHHLMLKTAFLKKDGLLYGKLGIAIAFFEYGKFSNNPILIDYGDELIDGFLNEIDDRVTRDFATGLCGFGWGIEYMIQRQFVDCDSNEACADIDKKVMAIDIRRMDDLTLETGLEGFIHYILIRLKGAMIQRNNRPFDDIYLRDIYSRLQSLSEDRVSSSLFNLKQIFLSYINNGALDYKLDICTFTNDLRIEDEEEILSSKLGLVDGLAGELIRTIYCI